MDLDQVTAGLKQMRSAREAWGKGRTEFFAAYDVLLRRYIYEACANYMGAAQIAEALGVGASTVRAKMRSLDLDPRGGKRSLNAAASQAMMENSALMGIDPADMDLTSPLAYLPMGSVLRKQLEMQTLSAVTEVEDTVVSRNKLEDRLYRVIVSRFEGMGEAWTTDSSGDTLARAAAQEAARVVAGPL